MIYYVIIAGLGAAVLGLMLFTLRVRGRCSKDIGGYPYAERMLSLLADNLPEIFFLTDPEVKGIQFVNSAFTRITGYEPGSFMESLASLIQIIHADDLVTARQYLAAIQGRPEIPHDFKPFRILTPSGETRWMHVRTFPLKDEEGKIKNVAVLCADITERHNTIEAMITSEKMKTVGGLAAGMAHEINNPLNIITLALEYIKVHLSPEMERNREAALKHGTDIQSIVSFLDEQKIIRYLDSIKDAVSRSGKIVSSMLSFSRPDSRCRSKEDLNLVLRESVELAERDYEMKKRYNISSIYVETRLAAGPLYVDCVRIEIEQVIINIIKNAVRAVHENREQRPEPHIIVESGVSSGRVYFAISDNGPGIPESIRARIFDPFYTTGEVGLNTGMGLYISYFLINGNHGGSIEALPAPEGGTTIKVTFPEDKINI